SFRSTGNGGNVTINTSRLVARNGGAVSALTFGTGRAGNVTVNATEAVELNGVGQVPQLSLPSSVSASAQRFSSALFPNPPVPNQTSGDVTINTGRLSVTRGAKVDVSHEGTAGAGTLRINANSILLDRSGTITAATTSGEGGNLNLNVRDFLLLRNNSQVTTSAGGSGNGGNIRINAGSIAAIPHENSDIRANSVNARGGNISINASGIFGIQFRSQDTHLSDITATGANSALSGTVQLNIEQSNPTSGLVELPTAVVDPSRLIAQGCPATQGNSFIISGRGGLPPNPEQQLDDDADWQDRRRLVVAQPLPTPAPPIGHRTLSPIPHPPILEATGWQTTPTGNIKLVATTPDSIAPNRLHPLTTCSGRL
ncbi:MAG TPA: S-layer family protein, partial [Coleofasciculaceae cyanobacterium]